MSKASLQQSMCAAESVSEKKKKKKFGSIKICILALLKARQLHFRVETSRIIVARTACVEILS